MSKFSTDRNKIQSETLTDENLKNDELYLTYKFEELIKEFLSSEYLALMIQAINVLIEKKFNLNVQHKAAEVCKSIFEFSCRILFSDFDYKKLLGSSNLSIFMQNYHTEVNELIQGLSSHVFFVRETCLNCLQYLVNQKANSTNSSPTLCLNEETYQRLAHRLLSSCFDVEASNRTIAEKIWKQGNFKTNEQICLMILDDVVHPIENVRLAAAEALAYVIKESHSNIARTVLQNLQITYEEKNVIIPPKLDQFGRPVNNQQSIDEWEARSSIGMLFLGEKIKSNLAKMRIIFVPENKAKIFQKK